MENTTPPDTLTDIFEGSIRTFAKQDAVVGMDGLQYSYADFGTHIAKLRAALRAQRVRPGDRVGLLGENSVQWTLAYAAIVTMGAVVVPIHVDLPVDEIRRIVGHSGCDLMFVSSQQAARMRDVENCTLRCLVLLENFELRPMHAPEGNTDSKQNFIDEAAAMPAAVVHQHDLAAIIYTSGTTGSPKGVMLTHGNIAHNVAMGREMQPVTSKDVFLSILPLSHAYECTLGFILPFYSGAMVHYLSARPSMKSLQETLHRIRPTMMLSVPLVMENLYRKQVLPRLTGSRFAQAVGGTDMGKRMIEKRIGKKLMQLFGGRLRFFGIGGSKLSAEVEEFLRGADFPYAIGYGLTETAPLLTGAPPSGTKFQAAGHVLGGMEVRVEVMNPATGEGELQARGPCVMKGYYNEPELTQKVFTKDGWLRTGDLAIIDSKGYITLKGRLKNMIVGPNGMNIHPEDIEAVINTHPFIEESIVVSRQQSLVAMLYFDREKIAASISVEEDDADIYLRLRIEELLPELKVWINERLSRHSRIDIVIEQHVPFEKTPSQTIRRFMHRAA